MHPVCIEPNMKSNKPNKGMKRAALSITIFYYISCKHEAAGKAIQFSVTLKCTNHVTPLPCVMLSPHKEAQDS